MKKKRDSVDSKVLARIYGLGRGAVFTPERFQDLGSTKAILYALARHTRAGTIRRLARGVYDYPRKHPKLGTLDPSTEEIAKAVAGKDALRLQPTGAQAANLLGLSTQVPMRVVYLTDGRARRVQIGGRQITLKHASPRTMATAGRPAGLVIQALRHIGRANVDHRVIAALKDRLDADVRRQLLKDARYAPAWIASVFRQLADGERP